MNVENIVGDVINFIDNHDIPIEITPVSLNYKNISFMWGKRERPNHKIVPIKLWDDWARNFDKVVPFISIKLDKNMELRYFRISEEEFDVFIKFLKKKYDIWDNERLDQIDKALND